MKARSLTVPLHGSMVRYGVRQRLPRRLVRNLGLFYLLLACLACLVIFGSSRSGLYQSLWDRSKHGIAWVKDKSIGALPILARVFPLTGEIPLSILAEGLPGSTMIVDAAGRQLSPDALRSVVQVVTDYDLAEPESLVAAVFPNSRSTAGPVRWEWVLQRGIQGYHVGSMAPSASVNSSMGNISDSAGEGLPKITITAEEYARAEVAVPRASGGVEESAGEVLSHGGGSKEVQPTAGPSPAATRLEGLARVNWGTAPLVAIYHTHTGETYRGTGVNSHKNYAWDVAEPGSGLVPGVVQVGERITRELQRRYSIPVIHSSKVHDYPIFAYAYSNSEKTAQMLVERYPSLQLVLDIHRDEGATLETVQGRQLASVLIVVATGGSGSLVHGSWRSNLAMAQQLKEDFDRLYPGLCRGLLVRDKARYNQHVHPGALLLEIGAHFDTLESALLTAELVADVLAETLWQVQSGSQSSPTPVRPAPLVPSLPMEIFEPKAPRAVLGL
ncbi:MAG: hypothetical protein GX322_01085 [Firmicutes bacterium]|nr:hypothetical protein [Bacillota bacterium]